MVVEKKLLYFSMLLPVASTFVSCDGKNATEAGQEAAIEFCACMKNNSEATCLSRLNSNYSSYTSIKSPDFMTAINDNSCNYDFYWINK